MFKSLFFHLLKIIVKKMECNKQNIELCFNDVKLMEFWNGVNVINNLSFRLIVYPITAIPFWQNFHIYEMKHS